METQTASVRLVQGGLIRLWDRIVDLAAEVRGEVFWSLLTLLALVLGWINRHQLNQDAIAYLRIARYWCDGDVGLAVNAYWGPLFSWLCVPGLAVGLPPHVAGRLTMVFGALVFTWGACRFMEGVGADSRCRALGRWVIGLNAAFWSVRQMTPDLMAAGFWLASLAFQARSPMTVRGWIAAGFLVGLAALAKAVFLPVGLAAGVLVILARRGLGAGLPTASVFLASVAVIVGGWVGILSRHEGRLMWSSTARIAYSISRPPALLSPHPSMSTLHQPPPGRVTTWENPTAMDYPAWAPWESGAAMAHQVRTVLVSLAQEAWVLSRHDMVGLGLMFWLIEVWGFLSGRSWAGSDSIRVLPLGILLAAYLPFPWLDSNGRFFYGALPVLWVSAWEGSGAGLWRWPESMLKRVMTALFGLTATAWVAAGLAVLPRVARAGPLSFDVARRLKAAGLAGPMAGSCQVGGGRVGLMLAFHLGQRWLGDDPGASAAAWRRSGARLIVVRRGGPTARLLEGADGFRNLDSEVFGGSNGRGLAEVQVWEVVAGGD